MQVAAFCRGLLVSTILAACCRETKGMIRYLPDSSSLVLKAAQIVQIRVDRVEAPDWNDQPTRRALLHLTVTEVWKGRLPAGPLVLGVTQARPQLLGPLLPPQGCWQDGRGKPGERWVVFTSSTSEMAAEALAEGPCLQAQPASETAIDIRIVDHIETDRLTLPAIVELVIQGADRLHLTFAQYLYARFGDLQLEERANLNAALELVTTPGLISPVRATLLDAVETYISHSQATTDWHIDRLAVAMFSLLSVPQASDMYENLIETDLPNLLGLTGGADKRRANSVFEHWPKERPVAIHALARYRGPADPKPLIHWLNEH
jgi:hypothetical protein